MNQYHGTIVRHTIVDNSELNLTTCSYFSSFFFHHAAKSRYSTHRFKRDTKFFSTVTGMHNCSRWANLLTKDDDDPNLHIWVEITPIRLNLKTVEMKVCALLRRKWSCFSPLVLYACFCISPHQNQPRQGIECVALYHAVQHLDYLVPTAGVIATYTVI